MTGICRELSKLNALRQVVIPEAVPQQQYIRNWSSTRHYLINSTHKVMPYIKCSHSDSIHCGRLKYRLVSSQDREQSKWRKTIEIPGRLSCFLRRPLIFDYRWAFGYLYSTLALEREGS